MTWTLENGSDFVGLLSGVALLITAFRNVPGNGSWICRPKMLRPLHQDIDYSAKHITDNQDFQQNAVCVT